MAENEKNRVGGKHIVDNMLASFLGMGIKKALRRMGKEPWMDDFIGMMPDVIAKNIESLPALTAGLVALLPKNSRPELVEFIAEIAESLSEGVAEVVAINEEGKSDVTERAMEEKTDSIVQKVVETAFVGTANRLYHRTPCAELQFEEAANAAAPEPQGGNHGDRGRDDHRQPRPRAKPLVRIPLTRFQIIDQGFRPCPTCLGTMRSVESLLTQLATARDAATPPKTETVRGKKRSWLEIVDSCPDEGRKKAFYAFIQGLAPEEESTVIGALKFLDSMTEFNGMMAVYESVGEGGRAMFIRQLETLLRADETKKSDAKGVLETVGDAVERGGQSVMGIASKLWNAELGDLAGVPQGRDDGDVIEVAPVAEQKLTLETATHPAKKRGTVVRALFPWLFFWEG